MALFLKYRPQTFEDLVGQESIAKTLRNALKLQKSAHAYLFSGSRGTGKTSTARIFAKALICPHVSNGNPCGVCEFCTKISEGNLIDVIEIDAASNRGIDEIRELREKINFSPTFTDKKVYIIDEVHMLTTPAFNALLKTLEEPPEHAFFLLATTERHKLPATIISRCQSFIFARFSITELVARLEYICEKEGVLFEKKALELMARKADGGMRDAISLLDQLSAETEKNITEQSVITSLGMVNSELLERCFSSLQEKNLSDALDCLRSIRDIGGDFRAFGHDFLLFLRQKMHQNLSSPELPSLLSMIESLEFAISRLKNSPFLELPFEIAFIKIVQAGGIVPDFLPNIDSIKKLPVLESGPMMPPVIDPPSIPVTEQIISESTGFVFETPLKIERTQQILEGDKLTSHLILERMKEFSEKANLLPSLKRPFLSATPVVFEDRIVFEVDNHFYYKALSGTAEIRVKLQEVISTVFKKTIFIDFKENINTSAGEPSKIATTEDLSDMFRA